MCNLILIYGYGVIMQVTERDGLDDFSVVCEKDKGISVEETEAKLAKYKADTYYYAAADIDDGNGVSSVSVYTGSNVYLIHVSKGNINELKKEKTVVVPDSAEDIEIGGTVTLNGHELNVKGSSTNECYLVSKETFTLLGVSPELITIDVPASQAGKLKKEISNIFGSGCLIHEQNNSSLDSASVSTLIVIGTIYLLCILSFMYLASSLYDDFSHEISIYTLIGASRKHIFALSGGIILLIIGITSAFSEIVHALLYDAVFSKMNILPGFEYTINDYLLLFIINVVTAFLFAIIYFLSKTRNSGIEAVRRTVG